MFMNLVMLLSSLLAIAVAAPVFAQGAKRLEDSKETRRLSAAEAAKLDKTRDEAFPLEAVIKEIPRGDVVITEANLRLRLIGVDVPTADEAHRAAADYYGREAMDYLRRLLVGKKVEIEYDEQKVDAYGQNFVYLTIGKTDVNADMVRRGYGIAACFAPNVSKCQNFGQYQREAMRAGRGLWDDDTSDWPEAPTTPVRTETVTVRGIADGDTITLTDGRVVRYLAIDAPENEQIYDEGSPANVAYEENYRLVAGRDVILEYDIAEKDPRGRTLAYVWVERDGRRILVNEELVRLGVAWVAVFPPNIARVGTLLKAQAEAKRNRVGVWALEQ